MQESGSHLTLFFQTGNLETLVQWDNGCWTLTTCIVPWLSTSPSPRAPRSFINESRLELSVAYLAVYLSLSVAGNCIRLRGVLASIWLPYQELMVLHVVGILINGHSNSFSDILYGCAVEVVACRADWMDFRSTAHNAV